MLASSWRDRRKTIQGTGTLGGKESKRKRSRKNKREGREKKKRKKRQSLNEQRSCLGDGLSHTHFLSVPTENKHSVTSDSVGGSVLAMHSGTTRKSQEPPHKSRSLVLFLGRQTTRFDCTTARKVIVAIFPPFWKIFKWRPWYPLASTGSLTSKCWVSVNRGCTRI